MRWTLFLLLTFQFAFAGNNLPQIKISATIKGKNHKILQKYFKQLDYPPDDFDPPVGPILTDALPKAYRTGCTQMISQWGKKAKGTGKIFPRYLHMKTTPDSVIHVFLAYTCFSDLPEFGNTYYDERLGILEIRPAASMLTMFPLSGPCTECPELSRMALADDTLQIDGSPVVTIVSANSRENPCCKDVSSLDEKNVYYFMLDPKGIRLVATVLEHRKEVVRREGMKDSTGEYSTTRFLERDRSGDIRKITTSYEKTANDQDAGRGFITMEWNRKRKAFDELRR